MIEDLAAQLAMAMDGYFSACAAERQAIERFFLLPNLENRRNWIQSTDTRHKMMKIVFERQSDYIVHIVEQFRSASGKEIDELTEQVNHLRSTIALLPERVKEL